MLRLLNESDFWEQYSEKDSKQDKLFFSVYILSSCPKDYLNNAPLAHQTKKIEKKLRIAYPVNYNYGTGIISSDVIKEKSISLEGDKILLDINRNRKSKLTSCYCYAIIEDLDKETFMPMTGYDLIVVNKFRQFKIALKGFSYNEQKIYSGKAFTDNLLKNTVFTATVCMGLVNNSNTNPTVKDLKNIITVPITFTCKVDKDFKDFTLHETSAVMLPCQYLKEKYKSLFNIKDDQDLYFCFKLKDPNDETNTTYLKDVIKFSIADIMIN